MKAKGAAHVGMAGNVMLCDHCGARQELTLPQSVDSVVGLIRAWTKIHRNCKPQPGVSAFRQARTIEDWPRSDDTGMSSRTIYAHMRGGHPALPAFPLDPSDFGRCYRLLALAPDWRLRIREMAAYGPEWQRLADAWDELSGLYESEVDTSVIPHRAREGGIAPRLYERMKELIGT